MRLFTAVLSLLVSNVVFGAAASNPEVQIALTGPRLGKTWSYQKTETTTAGSSQTTTNETVAQNWSFMGNSPAIGFDAQSQSLAFHLEICGSCGAFAGGIRLGKTLELGLSTAMDYTGSKTNETTQTGTDTAAASHSPSASVTRSASVGPYFRLNLKLGANAKLENHLAIGYYESSSDSSAGTTSTGVSSESGYAVNLNVRFYLMLGKKFAYFTELGTGRMTADSGKMTGNSSTTTATTTAKIKDKNSTFLNVTLLGLAYQI